MRRHQFLWLAAAVALAPRGAAAESSSWIFRPSCYSHAPDTGERVAQYQPEQPALAPQDGTYQQSGFRYYRSSIQFGEGEDHVHVVQTWGQGQCIRPYGEWEYPFRPGATPYGPWGNPQGPWTPPFGAGQNPAGLGRAPWGGGQGFNGPGPNWQGQWLNGPWSGPPQPQFQQQGQAPPWQMPAQGGGPGGQMPGPGGGPGGPVLGPSGGAGGQPPAPPVPPPPSP
jgi:hypothetical protein